MLYTYTTVCIFLSESLFVCSHPASKNMITVVLHVGFVYASSAKTVYRWPYKAGLRSDLGAPQVVVKNIPYCCDHVTR